MNNKGCGGKVEVAVSFPGRINNSVGKGPEVPLTQLGLWEVSALQGCGTSFKIYYVLHQSIALKL
jgi:hypothetical protein